MVTVLPEYLPYLPNAAQSPVMVAAVILLFGCLPGSGTPAGAALPLPAAVLPLPALPLLPLLLLLHAAAVASAISAAMLTVTFLYCIQCRPSQDCPENACRHHGTCFRRIGRVLRERYQTWARGRESPGL